MNRLTTDQFDKDYLKALTDPYPLVKPELRVEDLNENKYRPLLTYHTVVEMYNELAVALEEAKELVYQLTRERVLSQRKDNDD